MKKMGDNGMFTNTLALTRFMLNREKAISTAWVMALTAMSALFVILFALVVTPTVYDRAKLMVIAENPAVLLISGALHPYYGTSLTDVGVVFTTFMMVLFGVAVAVMNILLVVRHTRADEESGRYEVLRSLPCGRLSTINAVMLSALIVNVVMTVLLTLSIWITVGMGDSIRNL
jgi:ABC-2 type transport system permease protein